MVQFQNIAAMFEFSSFRDILGFWFGSGIPLVCNSPAW